MKHRGIRRHQAFSHMWRRVKEDRNQHYNDLTCACYQPGYARSRFKEQPQACSGPCCGNPRKWFTGNEKFSRQEQRAEWKNRQYGLELLRLTSLPE